MVVLSENDLDLLLPAIEIVRAVESALNALGGGACTVPRRMHVQWEQGTFLAMPAFASDRFGTKVVSVIPQNASRNLPVTNGLMILNDAATGLPTTLLNASRLTALRTGAVGAVAIKAMTPPDLDSVGIVGCGAQGLSQAVFAAAVRPVKLVHCFDRSAERAERCCTALRARLTGVTITRSPSPEHLLERSSAVVTATTSETPVLPGAPAALEGKHFFGIGSFRPSMQELPDAVFSLAGALVIDSDHAAAETGDIIQPLQKNLIPPDRVFTLADVILGRRHIDTSATTVFKSTGMALFDLFVAAALARAAEAKKIGQEVTL